MQTYPKLGASMLLPSKIGYFRFMPFLPTLLPAKLAFFRFRTVSLSLPTLLSD